MSRWIPEVGDKVEVDELGHFYSGDYGTITNLNRGGYIVVKFADDTNGLFTLNELALSSKVAEALTPIDE